MRSMRVAKVAYAAVFSMLVACSSNATVVSVNVLSSNDTQYNSSTLNGSRGGLLDPGIPDAILHPTIPTASNNLLKATKVRITITQGTLTMTRDVVPASVSFMAPVLDAAGLPVLDAMGKPTQATHMAIAPFYARFTLTSAWKDGPAQVTADALDASGNPFFGAISAMAPSGTAAAATPPVIQVKQNEAVAAFVDFAIPAPPTPSVAGGADGMADGMGDVPDAGAGGGSTGAGGAGGVTGGGGGGGLGGSAGAGGRGGAGGGLAGSSGAGGRAGAGGG
jgi:hypothetical protein